MQDTLFPVELKKRSRERDPEARREARVQRPVRNQYQMRCETLDGMLPEDHRARVVWDYVSGLDLSELYDAIRAWADGPGRAPIDPRILLALWLYATLDGVGSARALERLCQDHLVYQWICGGVTVNYHTLADFRVCQEGLLDRLLTESVAALESEGLVTMHRVALDGVRIRAGAGAASFRREERLEAFLAEAEAQVKTLREELEADPSQGTARERAARTRAARERRERVARAREELEKVKETRKKGRKEPRASTTDPEARIMKMANSGFNPAYNGQFAADTATQVIVGVEVSNCGSDGGLMEPMMEQLESRYGKRPEEVLVDGGFATHDDIEKSTTEGTTVYAPVRESADDQRDPHTPRKDDSPAVAQWRERMGTEEAKTIYKERASTIECVNAIARNRGLTQFWVRGLQKVRATLLWHALAHNLMRAQCLSASAAQAAA